jgi:tripartite-type tricarboxylate transporter receptor subunit TctC
VLLCRAAKPVAESHIAKDAPRQIPSNPNWPPAEIIDKLNKEINAALGDPKIKARLADLGGTALTGSPADFGKLIVEETEKWGKVVKFAGVKAD